VSHPKTQRTAGHFYGPLFFFLPFDKNAALFQNHWKFQKSEVGIFLKNSFWSLPKSNACTFRYGAVDFYAPHKKE